jgi:citrate lyase beta subunit
MLIISQNLTNYDIQIPKDAIFRVNLAWCDSINQLNNILKKHPNTPIFLDLPIKRIKPPNNRYAIEDLISVINSNEHIRYLAISNVESDTDLKKYVELLPKNLIIVPKIESGKAITNLQDIASALSGPEKIFMLDHDDLFADILKKNESESKFKEHVKTLTEFCSKNNIKLLRTIGVIFNDEEKRLSQYIN